MDYESSVRSYSRSFPVTFSRGVGPRLIDTDGREYIDFLSACGSLNYGHNEVKLKKSIINYVEQDGITMSMDLFTETKEQFIDIFARKIMSRRNLDYKLQFTGPTGANAIEAAVKLARKVTGRTNVIAFTNGFHGCSLGALALTGSSHHRSTSEGMLANVTRIPYEGFPGAGFDTADHLEELLQNPSSGVDIPAAIVLETIQGEGGLNSCSPEWAQKIALIAKAHGILLIVDDIQAGCGRSGNFFPLRRLG